MSDAVTKTRSAKAPKKAASKAKPRTARRTAAKKSPVTAQPDPAADLMADIDKKTGLEPLHDACETIRDFIETLSGWQLECDSLAAMSAVGLLQRSIFRIEGEWCFTLANDGGELKAALDKFIRPKRR